MTTTTPAPASARTEWRELDSHEADRGAIRVALLWHPTTQRIMIQRLDRRTGERWAIPVLDGQSQRDIYEHSAVYTDQAL